MTLRVEASVTVDRGVDAAFRLFTEDMGEWWPLASHSIGGEAAVGVTVEPRVGGRIYETGADGAEHDWGTVLAWDSPRLIRVGWRVNPEKPATTWEVRFEPEGEARTRVALSHWGWEAFGDAAAAEHADYSQGWVLVLSRLEDAA